MLPKPILLFMLLLSVSFSNIKSQNTQNWWNDFALEHRIHKPDSLIIGKYIFFSDSIVKSADEVFFGQPKAISKTNDGYYIYQAENARFNVADSILNFKNGLSVGFALFDSVYHPVSISEFNLVSHDLKKNRMISTVNKSSFSWIDRKYFAKFNNTITSSRKKD